MKPLIGFISDMSGHPWGGSEELWSQTATLLLQRGFRVAASVHHWPDTAAPLQRLEQLGLELTPRQFVKAPLNARLAKRFLPERYHPPFINPGTHWIEKTAPDLIIHSLSALLTDYGWMETCAQRNIPYAVIIHQASDTFWPPDSETPRMARILQQARRCYFVSQHNRRVAEMLLGVDLSNAEILFNPYNVPFDQAPPYPSDQEGFRLACVGRLDPYHKGQDLLLQVLATEKWKFRPLSVSLYGAGANELTLKKLTSKLHLNQVHFKGHTQDVLAIWKEHHVLILPSRVEGLPLALIEAMLSNRTAICAPAGGIPEIIDDPAIGFLAAAPTVACLDETLERAWQQRHLWSEMGIRAGQQLRQIVPRDPARTFADKIEALLVADKINPPTA